MYMLNQNDKYLLPSIGSLFQHVHSFAIHRSFWLADFTSQRRKKHTTFCILQITYAIRSKNNYFWKGWITIELRSTWKKDTIISSICQPRYQAYEKGKFQGFLCICKYLNFLLFPKQRLFEWEKGYTGITISSHKWQISLSGLISQIQCFQKLLLADRERKEKEQRQTWII
jgi:hypothetical protein